MADHIAIDILNGIVSGMIGQEVEGLGSIYFFLIFILLFSVSFAATAFVPMFKNKEEQYKNIRIIIALSIAFLTTISSYTIIVGQLQIFGLVAAIALGISVAILAVVPKEKREKAATPVFWVGIIGAILILVTFVMGIDWITPTLEWLGTTWSSFFSGTNTVYFIIFGIILLITVIVSIASGVKKQKSK